MISKPAFASAVGRRSVMLGGGAAVALYALRLPGTGHAAGTSPAVRAYSLVAERGRVPLVGAPYPETDVWCYGGRVPGPELRVRQGDRLRIAVENQLDEETTVHWHGLRVPNAMDGVPHLTQAPIAPGETFTYEFDVPDAGTFWYHPHQRSFEQVGRGLYGALIIEEPEPIPVDRDVTWVLDDWRLLETAAISDDFGNLHDVSHAGRVGNTATVNGRVPDRFAVRAGERIRLRLVNAANARIFGLAFEGHAPMVIALDGQPVAPHAPEGGRVVLGPAMRIDLILDMTGRPGGRFRVIDGFYEGLEYRLLDIAYTDAPPLRETPLDAPVRLSANPLAEPDLAAAERHEILFGGGMMGGMMSSMMDGRHMDMREMMRHGMAWTVNGVAATGHVHEPLITLARGRSCILTLRNETAWWHPIHLHGHAFRVITRDGAPTRYREWQDTVLLSPRETAEIAFVADNPGDWMLHCHILEHQAGGMMGVVRIA
ncbi:multicopper oxidase family protein [Virgifigura deserti]|uniref:multicopper oxidase family protein n=1 Tax=Virgifigura deserti TaxID=2268457 RepID=UPI003CCC065F